MNTSRVSMWNGCLHECLMQSEAILQAGASVMFVKRMGVLEELASKMLNSNSKTISCVRDSLLSASSQHTWSYIISSFR